MTDQPASGNRKIRRILAPHIWPLWSAAGQGATESGDFYYLSWPGWELFMARRWSLVPTPGGPQPLLLPGLGPDAEYEFASIDQLVRKAGEMGAGFLGLDNRVPESQAALSAEIAHYQGHPASAAGPLLDDRSYLILWMVSEYQTQESDLLLAQAVAQQDDLWAELKGLNEEDESGAGLGLSLSGAQPDQRSAYAWRCWHRLAAPLLVGSSDLIIWPTLPEGDGE